MWVNGQAPATAGQVAAEIRVLKLGLSCQIIKQRLQDLDGQRIFFNLINELRTKPNYYGFVEHSTKV